MKVIDANTGIEVKQGVPFTNVIGTFLPIAIHAGFFRASITLDGPLEDKRHDVRVSRRIRTVPLRVRWLHPSFLFQHVAFIES